MTDTRERIAELRAEADRLEQGLPWVPELGETYYAVTGSLRVVKASNYGTATDDERIASGNAKPTHEEAQQVADFIRQWSPRFGAFYRLVTRIAELDAESGWVADWANTVQAKHTAYLAFSSHSAKTRIAMCGVVSTTRTPRELHGSESTIETTIREMEADWRLLLTGEGE